MVNPVIEESWKRELADQFAAPYFEDLKRFLIAEKQQFSVYPPGPLIFNAFNLTPFDKVKVVILGQDPYHEPGQAHGLCFSVLPGTKYPPSLMNIFQELQSDLGVPVPPTGNLEGWETFTDAAISRLSEKRSGIVFLLWGSYAQAKAQLIDATKHYILTAPHPSPLSAYRGFFGCRHFSQTNQILVQNGQEPIHWEQTV